MSPNRLRQTLFFLSWSSVTKPTDTFDISVDMMSPFDVPNFALNSLTVTLFDSWILT